MYFEETASKEMKSMQEAFQGGIGDAGRVLMVEQVIYIKYDKFYDNILEQHF